MAKAKKKTPLQLLEKAIANTQARPNDPNPWRLARVTRADSGSRLWNAVHKTGREYFGCPSYDSVAMQNRVDSLNADKVKLYRGGRANPIKVLDEIFRQLDGQEWNSDTMSAVAEILTDAGYVIRASNEGEEDGE